MFAPGYFAPGYFAPRYWPPAAAAGWWPIELEKPRRRRRRIWAWQADDEHPITREIDKIAIRLGFKQEPAKETPEAARAKKPELAEPGAIKPDIESSLLPPGALLAGPQLTPTITHLPTEKAARAIVAERLRYQEALALALEQDDEEALLMILLEAA